MTDTVNILGIDHPAVRWSGDTINAIGGGASATSLTLMAICYRY